MNLSQQLVKQATDAGKMPLPYLGLVEQIKDEGGNKKGVQGTGPHTLKWISAERVMDKDYHTQQPVEKVKYVFEENGVKKQHNVAIKNKKGELHYFHQRMAEAEIGQTMILEYKKKPNSYEGYIDFKRPAVSDDDIPIYDDRVIDQVQPDGKIKEVPYDPNNAPTTAPEIQPFNSPSGTGGSMEESEDFGEMDSAF